MGTRDGPIQRAQRRMAEDERRVRAEIAMARRSAGLSQDAVGAACGISGSTEGRIERGETGLLDLRVLARIGAAVGVDIRIRADPAGDAIRDAGQRRLLERLRAQLHPLLQWATEVTLPIEGDLRAWDAVIRGPGWRIAVEAETVLDDVQAVERRLALKQRDGGVAHVILLVADTRRNRRALRAASGAFAGLPLHASDVLRALRAGREPAASGVVVL